jgi:2-polyprenyl-3-methyl-5-hydroxy-6-metoxy-1,4-benzoquinol methylase/glycosyltransferase involved in cell wall biosynthesis
MKMKIVMHCGGIPFNGNTVNEKSLGGSESAAYYLARELASYGCSVTLFTNHPDGGEFEGVNYVWAGNINEQTPLGHQFEYYARNTPHDILIIQRHPQAFTKSYASKMNVLWLHDLSMYRTKDAFLSQMWNVDLVLTVSEYHKQQVCEVYNIKPEFVSPVLNGVDITMFDNPPKDAPVINFVASKSKEAKLMIYSSRPERGLENLVKPNGIMDQLKGKNVHLLVCGYDNVTPQMKEYYEYLWGRCHELDNVTNIGALTKPELAAVMNLCSMHIYPTNFEEVSCITAMEAAAAGNVFISSEHAALPETCKGNRGTALIPLKDGKVDDEAFVAVVEVLLDEEEVLRDFQLCQKECSSKYSWKEAGRVFRDAVVGRFYSLSDEVSVNTLTSHFMRMSDIVHLNNIKYGIKYGATIANSKLKELNECYSFYEDGNFAEHYKNYYQYEKDRGVNYGPESLEGNLRFETVYDMFTRVEPNSFIVDYGCAHGHYTINLAKRFPKLNFVGVDIEQTNIEKAEHWAEDEGLTNVSFICSEARDLSDSLHADVLLAAEVLEHTGDVDQLVKELLSHVKVGGKMVITTPYGPWEAQGYLEHWPWRAHLYEFSYDDIQHMYGHLQDFSIATVPSGMTQYSEPLGSYVYSFTNTGVMPNKYEKVGTTIPKRQTLSLCMIVKDAEKDIERCLASALPICDEVVVGIDETSNNQNSLLLRIKKIVEEDHKLPLKIYRSASPIEVGFDDARNMVLSECVGDWVMWLDSDEELHNPQAVVPYLRNSQYDGIALPQHHISAMPAGVLKTDTPCKIFRNNKGIKFYGVVHEHPELEFGKGVEYVCGVGDAIILHHGYSLETTRRQRFKRNLELLKRDREKYPTRSLGKFLYIRDLAQMNKFQLEQMPVTDDVLERCDEAIKLWRELLDENLKMAIEAVPFYSECVRLLGKGFEYSLSLDTGMGQVNALNVKPVDARFFNYEHASSFQTKLLNEKVKYYESRYY